MANFFYLIFYIIRLALHWVRLAIYYLYGVVIFLAQPGARYLIPAALIATAYFGNAAIISSEAYFTASKSLFAWFPAMIDFLKDFDPWLIEPDGFLYAMAVLLSGAVYFGSPILQRLVATFPAMRRPLAPVLRRDPPRHVIRTANVRPVVPKLVQRYWGLFR